MSLFDVHAHLTDERLYPEVSRLLARASAAGLTTVISNGLNPSDNQKVFDLSRTYPLIKPAFGWYPVDAVLGSMRRDGHDYPHQRQAWDAEAAIGWVAEHLDQAFAVGEIGLDGYWVPEPYWQEQELAFRRLVGLAMDAKKVAIIHTRKRERRALEVLLELGAQKVNWHCFGGKVTLARSIAEHGHYLSIPANARRSESFTRMLQTLPRDRILLETDCPYLGPDRELPNEPANVRHTLAYVSELWGVPESVVEQQLSDNFSALFGTAP